MDVVEQALARRAKQNDVHAFAQLVELYKDRIVSFLYRLTGNREDARDLAQDVFLRLYNNLHTYDSSLRFSPWLYRIAQNIAIDFLRRKKNIVYLDEPLGEFDDQAWQLEDDEPWPDEVVEFKDLQSALEQAMARLNPMYRSVLVLRFAEEMSYEDIAKVLNLPQTTVKTRLHRAREALRRLLIERGYFEDSQRGEKDGLR
ncbi:MAG: ECF RNA polymerase sigma factor SigW [Firmicutes bacterium]|nr:ECF RNA polymerase sigma factor SigW [Bacillota bacterium]